MNFNKNLRVIKTSSQYHAYLCELDSLMAKTIPIGTEDSDRLELLTVLLEDYENKQFPVEHPDPIDAIKFRMAEEGLVQADLVPYFGRASRVSEVLSGKRDLTLDMIRKVSIGMGISTDILLGMSDSNKKEPMADEVNWLKFPIKEILSRRWIKNLDSKSEDVQGSIQSFIEEYLMGAGKVSFRRNLKGDAVSDMRQYAIYAWLARILQKSREIKSQRNVPYFSEENISTAFLKKLARLSTLDDGPQKAIKLLEENGILVIFEPRIEKTLLDGAALKDTDGTPIIGMTLRYDRLDSFWFTLLHEVVHVWKHINGIEQAIVDNLDNTSDDRQEAEANRLAREAFIPRIKWKRSKAYLNPSRQTVQDFAEDLGIHPSIVVGRLHYDKKNYTLLSDIANVRISNKFKFEMGLIYEK